jgi:hypothetical protein
MESNQFLARMTTAQKALFFTRMCELVDQATLGLNLRGRPLSVEDLLEELSDVESSALVVSTGPFMAAVDFASRHHPRDILMVGDIHGRRPALLPAFGSNFDLSTRLNDMFKMPDNLTLKAVSQGVQWRKKMKAWGYSISAKPDGFGKVTLTLKRHGRSLTVTQGTSVPHTNQVGADAVLDPFMLRDLRAAGALIEKR